jgi:exopolysaccharide biosynthesis protein
MNIIGRKIVDVIALSKDIVEAEGWENSPYSCIGLLLDDGNIIYPSQDEEGNGPGALFGKNVKEDISVFIMTSEEV